MSVPFNFRGAQAASLQFAAACREHPTTSARVVNSAFPHRTAAIYPAGSRAVQAGSLRSPEPCASALN